MTTLRDLESETTTPANDVSEQTTNPDIRIVSNGETTGNDVTERDTIENDLTERDANQTGNIVTEIRSNQTENDVTERDFNLTGSDVTERQGVEDATSPVDLAAERSVLGENVTVDATPSSTNASQNASKGNVTDGAASLATVSVSTNNSTPIGTPTSLLDSNSTPATLPERNSTPATLLGSNSTPATLLSSTPAQPDTATAGLGDFSNTSSVAQDFTSTAAPTPTPFSSLPTVTSTTTVSTFSTTSQRSNQPGGSTTANPIAIQTISTQGTTTPQGSVNGSSTLTDTQSSVGPGSNATSQEIWISTSNGGHEIYNTVVNKRPDPNVSVITNVSDSISESGEAVAATPDLPFAVPEPGADGSREVEVLPACGCVTNETN